MGPGNEHIIESQNLLPRQLPVLDSPDTRGLHLTGLPPQCVSTLRCQEGQFRSDPYFVQSRALGREIIIIPPHVFFSISPNVFFPIPRSISRSRKSALGQPDTAKHFLSISVSRTGPQSSQVRDGCISYLVCCPVRPGCQLGVQGHPLSLPAS